MKQNNWQKGLVGQDLVRIKYLESGYELVTENFEYRENGKKLGEIDLIFKLEKNGQNILVFVEVKLRNNQKFGSVYEQIRTAKLARLKQAANVFIFQNPEFKDYFLRFDAGFVYKENVKILQNII